MKKLYVFIGIAVVLILGAVWMLTSKRKEKHRYTYVFEKPLTVPVPGAGIPRVVHLTCKDKAALPEKVVRQWQQLNPSYSVEVHDDADCVRFLREEYGSNFADVFN